MPVNMPEKKDSMGQMMEVFKAAKSIYDTAKGSPSDPGAKTPPKAPPQAPPQAPPTKPVGAAPTGGKPGGMTPAVSSAMDRRLQRTQGTV